MTQVRHSPRMDAPARSLLRGLVEDDDQIKTLLCCLDRLNNPGIHKDEKHNFLCSKTPIYVILQFLITPVTHLAHSHLFNFVYCLLHLSFISSVIFARFVDVNIKIETVEFHA